MSSKNYEGTLIVGSHHAYNPDDGHLRDFGRDAIQSLASRLVAWADEANLSRDKVVIAYGVQPRHADTADIYKEKFAPNAELRSISELAVQGDEFPIDIELVADAVWKDIADFPLAILVASYPYTGSLTSAIHVHGISGLSSLEYGEARVTLPGGMHYTFRENGMIESFRPKL